MPINSKLSLQYDPTKVLADIATSQGDVMSKPTPTVPSYQPSEESIQKVAGRKKIEDMLIPLIGMLQSVTTGGQQGEEVFKAGSAMRAEDRARRQAEQDAFDRKLKAYQMQGQQAQWDEASRQSEERKNTTAGIQAVARRLGYAPEEVQAFTPETISLLTSLQKPGRLKPAAITPEIMSDIKNNPTLTSLATAYTSTGDEASGKEFWKRYKGGALAGREYSEAEQKQLNAFLDRIDKDNIVKRSTQSIAAATPILHILSLNNPIADEALRVLIPRLMGEVGNLSEAEQQAYGGSQAISATLGQILERARTGKLSSENRTYLNQLANQMKTSQGSVLNDRLDALIPQTSKISGIPEDELKNIVSTYYQSVEKTDFSTPEEAEAYAQSKGWTNPKQITINGKPKMWEP